jgi:hypothetical protein
MKIARTSEVHNPLLRASEVDTHFHRCRAQIGWYRHITAITGLRVHLSGLQAITDKIPFKAM